MTLFSASAFADYKAVISAYMYNGRGIYYADPQVACTCASGIGSGSSCTVVGSGWKALTIDSSIPPNCIITFNSGATQILKPSVQYKCPYGGTFMSNDAYGKEVNMCIGADPPPNCPKDQKKELVWKVKFDPATNQRVSGGPHMPYASDGSCLVQITNVVECWGDKDGNSHCRYEGVTTGAAQNAGSDDYPQPESAPYPPDVGNTAGTVPTPPIKADNQGDCIKGTVQAGVDSGGIPICIGTGTKGNSPGNSSTTTKPPVTTTDADGSTTKTEVTESTNADGSTTTTTKTTTTKPDGTVSVDVKATTGATPSGSAGKPSDKNEGDFCSKHPDLTACKNSTVSGKCGEIACTGDAIQCATLRATAAMQCQQQKDIDDAKASPLTTLGNSIVAGNDPASGTLPTKGNASVVNVPSSLDTNGWLGGGFVGFQDFSFTVQGKTIVIPLAKATGYLVGLRYALMVIASLVSFRILSGVILRD